MKKKIIKKLEWKTEKGEKEKEKLLKPVEKTTQKTKKNKKHGNTL